MKKVKIEDAIGKTICHDMTGIVENGVKKVLFKRNHVITDEDLESLRNIGKNHIFIYEEGVDEVHEEDAAIELSKELLTDDFYLSNISEGKLNLIANKDGIFKINVSALRSLLSVPDYTIVCINNNKPVKKGDIVVSFRIVPLVTKKENVSKAVSIAHLFKPIFRIIEYKKLRCGLIVTGNEVFEGRIKDAFNPIITEKLKSFNVELERYELCPDNEEIIVNTINSYKDIDLIFISGGMSVDPDDVTVNAIKSSNAHFIIRGMHVQPGNMLSLALKNEQMILGIPAASMHSKITSLDIMLPRLFAGDYMTEDEILNLSIGGLINSKQHILNIIE